MAQSIKLKVKKQQQNNKKTIHNKNTSEHNKIKHQLHYNTKLLRTDSKQKYQYFIVPSLPDSGLKS